MKRIWCICLVCFLFMSFPFRQGNAQMGGDWAYEIEGEHVVLHGYYGDRTDKLEIPRTIQGKPVTRIGISAFLGQEMSEVSFPDTLICIEDFAFSHCSNLRQVHIPEGVDTIGIGAFSQCPSLAGIWVSPDNPRYASDEQGVLYSKDGRILLQVPGSFRGKYQISKDVEIISSSAFNGCSELTEITIAKSVREIGGYAFCECSGIKELFIPAGVVAISNTAFERCTSLSRIRVAEDNPSYYSNENGWLYQRNTNAVVCTPGGFTGNYQIEPGATEIGNNALSDCQNITSITIPDSVTRIGSYAFYGCHNLKTVDIPDSVTEIDAYAFQSCEMLETVNIPSKVTHIQWGLFRGCESLRELPIHDAVTIIDDFAFAECNGLTNIVIPASVIYIGHYGFRECKGLENIFFCGDAPEFVNHEGINGSFAATTANAYYHKGTQGWTEEAKAKTGGNITWIELEHIVFENSPDSKCLVCGEVAQPIILKTPSNAFPSNYRVVGNTQWMGYWDPASAEGRMLQVEPEVYRFVAKNVPAGEYQFQITQGNWDTAINDNGNNFFFIMDGPSDVTFTLCKQGDVYSVDVEAKTITFKAWQKEDNPKTNDQNRLLLFLLPVCVGLGGLLVKKRRKDV